MGLHLKGDSSFWRFVYQPVAKTKPNLNTRAVPNDLDVQRLITGEVIERKTSYIHHLSSKKSIKYF